MVCFLLNRRFCGFLLLFKGRDMSYGILVRLYMVYKG